jgi:phage terminase large subunit-like protein
VLCQPLEGGGYKLQGHYFIPRDRMDEAEKRDRVPYRQWANEGYVTATPGSAIDYSYVHRRILDDCDRYQVGAVAYDPWNAEPTRIALEGEGVVMVKMRQGYGSLSGPSKELERAVISRQLDHQGDPVMEWCAENAEVRTDENGNIRPVKPEHGSGKRIDGIVAAIMAIGMAQLTEMPGPSIYEQPGNLAL